MKKWKEILKTSTLQQKMALLCWMGLFPLFVLVIFTLIRMTFHYQEYDQIVRNITAANAYNLSFKENLDDTMYRIITGSEIWDDSNEKQSNEDPYTQIQEVRDVFESLEDITTTENNKKRIRDIEKTLDTLEDRVDDILANVQETGHYDENMEMLDMNIRILTELVQKEIQEYIYYEATSLETMREQVSKETGRTIQITFTLGILILIVGWALARYLAKVITKPLDELCELTTEVSKGNFDVEVHVESGDEIETLADSFNSMVGEISNLVEHIKIEQKNVSVAEAKLLQAQINPHFLYNTLDTIIWLAEDNQKEQVVSMVSSLSDFFRTTLSKGKDLITIGEEELHVKSYLEIQQFRYGDIMSYDIQFEEEIRENYILKLTLQPIIENALYHGIKNQRGKGQISVSGKRQGDEIIFTVKDNGIGMKPEELGRLTRIIEGEEETGTQNGFGMANVEKRIRLNYGQNYGIQVQSEYEQGTTVTVNIPIISTEEEILTKS